MKPDDCSLTQEQYKAIRLHAQTALLNAGAFGVFPTPVEKVMEAAKLVEGPSDAFDDNFLNKIRAGAQRFGGVLKRALSKVLGVIDLGGRVIYVDRAVHTIKRVFLRLHEVGHSMLPWQRSIYCAVEDCEKTLSPEIAEAFDREANVFASEVLFQLDGFATEAADYNFSIKVPIKLSKKYGASVYSSVRQYVSKHQKACVVLVLNPPEPVVGDGFKCSVRRVIASSEFEALFGALSWPQEITSHCQLGRYIPFTRKMSGPRRLVLSDDRGEDHECLAEAFNSTHQVFLVIHEVSRLTATTVSLA